MKDYLLIFIIIGIVFLCKCHMEYTEEFHNLSAMSLSNPYSQYHQFNPFVQLNQFNPNIRKYIDEFIDNNYYGFSPPETNSNGIIYSTHKAYKQVL